MPKPRIVTTHHARDRFHQRIAPSASPKQIADLLWLYGRRIEHKLLARYYTIAQVRQHKHRRHNTRFSIVSDTLFVLNKQGDVIKTVVRMPTAIADDILLAMLLRALGFPLVHIPIDDSVVTSDLFE